MANCPTLEKDIASLASDFSKLSLDSKGNAIIWLTTNFPDSPTKTSLLQHLENPDIVLLDKFYKKKGNQITFYVHVYNKAKKTNYCRHITLSPRFPGAIVTSKKVPRAYKKQKTISSSTPLLSSSDSSDSDGGGGGKPTKTKN
uniref:Uncharacterized protein n=1 Tax=Paramoeba aestuarina TaxID=180227 RepID=A0A7S4KHE8_9EUKA|mmetsp:Transcript_1937/g.2978  ORF Transcript_1937/g.2978 Transcript_1937/m.2978 type:complete len:143 (+) Transcript_1937:59-487(+)